MWWDIIIPSALFGFLLASAMNGVKSLLIAVAVPWLTLAGWVVWGEYFAPYRGGGASMWPVAILFGGSTAFLAAFIGWLCGLALRFLPEKLSRR